MIWAAAFLILLGLFWLAVSGKAAWRERARSAEAQNKTTRRAHAVKNRIALDPAERQRVRDHFDAR